jgi:hypothetical protein|nr:hypothetical protein [uncultured Mediterranean phage uvMED]|tara:strand:- start:184 stop:366 length:183 start_codon:yes stop_codon:yes gene_type:complete
MIYCVVWKQDDKYKMFTNTIFQSEDKAIEFADKQKSMRKKHDCRVVEFDYKYFDGVDKID